MTTTIGAREARKNLRQVLDAAMQRQAVTIIQRNGTPVAVIIPWSDYVMLYPETDDNKITKTEAQL